MTYQVVKLLNICTEKILTDNFFSYDIESARKAHTFLVLYIPIFVKQGEICDSSYYSNQNSKFYHSFITIQNLSLLSTVYDNRYYNVTSRIRYTNKGIFE
jgi:hypothetical protein